MASDTPGAPRPAAAPQRLHRLIMRRATWVAVPVLAAALVLGALRMADDVAEEVEAAASLALAMAELGRLGAAAKETGEAEPAAVVLGRLQQLQQARPLRHLRLQVADEAGRPLLPAPPEPAGSRSALAAWASGLTAGPRWLVPAAVAPQPVSWPLPRPGGGHWTVTLSTSPEAERHEALQSLAEHLLLLAALVAGLLLVMRANLARALTPLARLVAAIGGIERADTGPVRALPPMSVAELDAVAGALRHLGAALDEAEQARRRLARQVLTLQEDERARLARELHDEFGQRLTALRVDAAWLARRLGSLPAAAGAAGADAAAAEAAQVARGMADQCGLIQQDIRQLLARLQPFGPAREAGDHRSPNDLADDPGAAAATDVSGGPDTDPSADAAGVADAEPVQRLAALLDGLVQAWAGQAAAGLAVGLSLAWRSSAAAPPQPWSALPAGLALDRGLALALYRISQEALTNVARHANARQAGLALTLTGAPQAGAALTVDWQVSDDGCGLPDSAAASRRGNGLAGLRERVWAQGGTLEIGPARPDAQAGEAGEAGRPGCRLAARLQTRWRTA